MLTFRDWVHGLPGQHLGSGIVRAQLCTVCTTEIENKAGAA